MIWCLFVYQLSDTLVDFCIRLAGEKALYVQRQSQTACRALGSRAAERGDTWPAVNKEHPLRTTRHQLTDTRPHIQTLLCKDMQSYKNILHRDTIFTLHLTKYMRSDGCVYTSKNTQTRIIMPSLLDTEMNKQTKTNK